jgi:hypothetical protein
MDCHGQSTALFSGRSVLLSGLPRGSALRSWAGSGVTLRGTRSQLSNYSILHQVKELIDALRGALGDTGVQPLVHAATAGDS